jgi:hypothetical protein
MAGVLQKPFFGPKIGHDFQGPLDQGIRLIKVPIPNGFGLAKLGAWR